MGKNGRTTFQRHWDPAALAPKPVEHDAIRVCKIDRHKAPSLLALGNRAGATIAKRRPCAARKTRPFVGFPVSWERRRVAAQSSSRMAQPRGLTTPETVHKYHNWAKMPVGPTETVKSCNTSTETPVKSQMRSSIESRSKIHPKDYVLIKTLSKDGASLRVTICAHKGATKAFW